MTGTERDNGEIVLTIPGWLKGVLTAFIMGAVGWGYNVNHTLTETQAEIKSLREVTAERFTALKERMDREDRKERNNSPNR